MKVAPHAEQAVPPAPQPLLRESTAALPTLRNLCRNFRELLMSMLEMWPYPPSMPSTVAGTSFQYVLALE